MSGTKIEWADETINPMVGCTRISPACDHCYAIGMAHRHGGNPVLPQYKGLTYMTPGGLDWTGEVRWVPGVLEKALLRLVSSTTPKRIFLGSMTDIAHETATVQHLANVLAFAAALPHHTIMLLTKRPALLRERMEALRGPGFADVWDAARNPLYMACRAEAGALAKRNMNSSTPRERALQHRAEYIGMMCADPTFPLRNVWLGTTIWDQASADRAVPILLSTPAAKRFVSVEPMLGPVLLTGINWGVMGDMNLYINALHTSTGNRMESCGQIPDWRGLDWVICGGETGKGARPMVFDWAIDLRDQCEGAHVPFFFKQFGEWASWCPVDLWKTAESRIVPLGNGGGKKMWRVGTRRAGRLLDGQEWSEVPHAD